MSDWGATNSVAESIEAGCDLEMPGPAKWRGKRALQAVEAGELSTAAVEKAAGNVLYLIDRIKGIKPSVEPPERSNDSPELRQAIRKAGVEGLTLLKNDRNILPISRHKKIAVIGPNAKRAIAHGGGSASLNPLFTVTPFDGLRAATSGEVSYSQGCDTAKWLPLVDPHCSTPTGEQGLILEYYKGDRFKGDPVDVQHKSGADLFLWDSAPKEVMPTFSFKVKTIVTPKTSGNHTFSFSSVGPGRMFLDGDMLIDNWNWSTEGEAMFSSSEDILETVYLEAGKPVHVLVESTNESRPEYKKAVQGEYHYGGCRIGYEEERQIDLLQEAVDAAKSADVAIVVVGLDAEWESEGYDRKTMDLPKNGSQDLLIRSVLAANPNTVVVNQSGTPVTMPWADDVPAILQAWYQGQEAGNALADVVFGACSPSGKLPTTFPRRLEDNPAFHNWPGEDDKVMYGEGIYIGYRHYETGVATPLFPFGHGLSYTAFEYGSPKINNKILSEAEKIDITIPITNTGAIAAGEIVQGYVKDVKSRIPRPEKELQAFAKVFLEPGETKKVTLTLNKYSVGYYDTTLNAWIAEEGDFEVLIGASSVDIR